jgi:transcriptional regulator with XRE-family HTH domain
VLSSSFIIIDIICQFIAITTTELETLGQSIKKFREENKLPLRKLAAYLDMDQAILSKIEHGTRMPKREQVVQLAKYFKTDAKPLLIQWLAAKVVQEVYGDENALEALHLAENYLNVKAGKNKGQASVLDYLKLGEATKKEKMFIGDNLPSYTEFAQYLFNTATGKKLDENAINMQTGFIGEGTNQEIYLFYRPNREWLKTNALTLNMIKQLPEYKGKTRLIFASLKYVNDESCRLHHVEFGQIPY